MTEEEKAFLESEINRQYQWYNRGSKLWSAVHHWSLAVSALLSALATLVLKSEWVNTFVVTYRDDVAAGLAAAATLVTTLAASGGFGKKWQANRRSRGRMDQVKIDFSSPKADPQRIREDLKAIIKQHDDSIIGSTNE
ncbi:MAG TPA: SLATT domain-containing protein [Nitrospira sp.]|nr:SLATT domain-containing protein [Nitrospira sp.]